MKLADLLEIKLWNILNQILDTPLYRLFTLFSLIRRARMVRKSLQKITEKMLVQIRIEAVENDGRSKNAFKDFRESNVQMTRTQAAQLMDALEKTFNQNTKPL